MKLSELIKAAQEALETHGDLHVLYENRQYDGSYGPCEAPEEIRGVMHVDDEGFVIEDHNTWKADDEPEKPCTDDDKVFLIGGMI